MNSCRPSMTDILAVSQGEEIKMESSFQNVNNSEGKEKIVLLFPKIPRNQVCHQDFQRLGHECVFFIQLATNSEII